MNHDTVLKTFIIYITIKAMIFLPLAWAALIFWWNDSERSSTPAEQ